MVYSFIWTCAEREWGGGRNFLFGVKKSLKAYFETIFYVQIWVKPENGSIVSRPLRKETVIKDANGIP